MRYTTDSFCCIGPGSYSKDGFTLLEVLVALSIVSVGIVAAAKLITQSIDIQDEMQKRFTANLVTSNYINGSLERNNGLLSSVASMSGYQWEIKVDYSVTPNADVSRIDVSATMDSSQYHGKLFYYKANLNERSDGN